jgi:hypothetical protein
MKKMVLAGVCILAMGVQVHAADERYSHFESLPSETLPQAVANFSDYNAKLEAILAKGDLDDDAIYDIHQITYTLEVALQKINEELAVLADTLEELHLASERVDGDAVSKHGRAYLDMAREVIK